LPVLVILLCQNMPLSSQILLNECSHTNISTIADENDDYEDWIEIRIVDPIADLSQYFLSDRADNISKWPLPSIFSDGNELQLIWASGKNRRPELDHYEAAVLAELNWKYRIPVNSDDDLIWFGNAYDDNDWLTGPGGIGYGDGDDGTIIPLSRSVYMRQTFLLTNAQDVEEMKFFMDYDDGFIAYLNGVEIARNFMGMPGIPASFDQFSTDLHEANVYQGFAIEEYAIDSELIESLLVDGLNVLAVQAHNYDAVSSDLSCIPYLIFGMGGEVFQTNQVPAWYNPLLSTEWHTNFKLSTGEWLYLSNEEGLIIDSLQMQIIDTDHSMFRFGNDWCFTNEPSPGLSNDQECMLNYNSSAGFNYPAGIYPSSLVIELSTDQPNAEIYFTMDGSVPDTNDILYTEPFEILVSTVISARTFSSEAGLPSHVEKNSYFINEAGLSIPVISISSNPENIWSDSIGIYVLGYPDYSPNWPYYGANYWEDWERSSYIEYFDGDSVQQFEGSIGLKIFGGASRTQSQKSLRVKCRDDYGMDEIAYPLIPDKPHITTFKNFNLRNSSQDFYNSRMRDAYMQQAMIDTDADIMGYRHVVVFLNGEYWGHHELRETQNADYIEDNHDVPAEDVSVVANGFDNGALLFQALDGDLQNFYEMFNPIVLGDPNDAAFFAMADSMLDTKNFADYTIAETYYANTDFSYGYPNNIKCWGAPGKKWRHALWDLDFGMGFTGASVNDDFIYHARNDNFHFDRLCNAMLNNYHFRVYFINRYADLINTIFQHENMSALGQAMRAELEPAIARHHQRWGGDYWSFFNGMENLINWNQGRVQGARNVVQSHFSLPGQVDIVLEVIPFNAGRIHISTIEPSEEEYPWDGVYFMDVPVRITAIPNPGFTFDYWEPNSVFNLPVLNNDTTLFFPEDINFTAVFQGEANENTVKISELMYHPDSSQTCGEWLELYNPLQVPISLSGLYFKDSDYFHRYDFPFNGSVGPGEYLIIAKDTAAFKNAWPDVQNVFGPLHFSFNNNNEHLYLFNQSNDTIAKAYYSDEVPWPLGTDGFGRSLESIEPSALLDSADRWFSGCVDGSPGAQYSPCSNNLVISEINYNSALENEAGDWFELHNLSNNNIDLSGFVISDANSLFEYEVPSGTILEPDSFLVFCSDVLLFSEVHFEVENYIGTLPFAFNSTGDCIKLYSSIDELILSVEYDNLFPWPLEADGLGKTLELLDPLGIMCNGNNWFPGCDGGSPGMAYDPECPEPEIIHVNNSAISAYSLYPNPASSEVYVKGLTRQINAALFDSNGRALKFYSLSPSQNQIEVSGISNGIYILQLQNDDKVEYLRVVLRR